jgi:YidC/Oxa1 family membrane protein insertase
MTVQDDMHRVRCGLRRFIRGRPRPREGRVPRPCPPPGEASKGQTGFSRRLPAHPPLQLTDTISPACARRPARPRTSFTDAAALALAAPVAAVKTATAAASGGAAVVKAGAAAGAAKTTAATATATAAAADAPGGLSRYSGWLSAIADPLEDFLLKIQGRLRSVNCPYPQGFSIILLTAMVKVVTFPFTKKQVESSLAMQNLQPQIKALRERWAGDDNAQRLTTELNTLYKRYGVNPLAGCVPTLLTLPVFWGLYRALINGSLDGAFAEPFFVVPSLAGPTYDIFAGNSGGISWLWPLDPATHAPPIGWPSAQAYLVLPTLLVVSQYVTSVIIPPTQPDAEEKESETAQNVKLLTKVLPLFVGYFSLTLPAGMGLYWVANNVFTTATTYYLKELGGAQTLVPKLEKPKLKLGTAIRSGIAAEAAAAPPVVAEAAALSGQDAQPVVVMEHSSGSEPPVAPAAPASSAAVAVELTPASETRVAPAAPLAAEQTAAPAPAAVAAAPAAAAAAAPLGRVAIPGRSKRLKDVALRKTPSNPGGKTQLPA